MFENLLYLASIKCVEPIELNKVISARVIFRDARCLKGKRSYRCATLKIVREKDAPRSFGKSSFREHRVKFVCRGVLSLEKYLEAQTREHLRCNVSLSPFHWGDSQHELGGPCRLASPAPWGKPNAERCPLL